jgi:polysaccharide biosynthesis transport protein
MNASTPDFHRQTVDWMQVIRNRLGTALLTFILTFAVAAIITYVMPRKYRGRVEMKIERKPEIISLTNQTAFGQDPMSASEIYIKTEFETITKAETLYPVIEKFDLTKRWGMPSRLATFHKLVGNLDPVAAVRSDFVVIEYYDEDAKLAADIANAVDESYMTKRVEKASEQQTAALASVKKQIETLDADALKERAKMFAIQKESGIIDPTAGMMAARTPGATVENDGTMTNTYRENELYKLNTEIIGYREDLKTLSQLTGDQLVERASALKVDNQTIASLYPDFLKLKSDREDLVASGRGRQHPTVKGVDAKLASLQQQIMYEAQQHVEGLKNKLAASESRHAELKKLHETTKNDAIDKQGASLEYLTARRNLEHTEALLQTLKQQYTTTSINDTIVKSPATIWQRAEVESAPAKPRIPLNLAIGGLVGVLFGLGLAFALEFMDTTVKSIDDVERYLGIQVLAIVPKGVGILHHTNGLSPDTEAYRILRTNLEFNRKNANANCLTVVSGSAGEGKSTTICNLAFVCAQAGYNVLLIDADLRRPRQHTLFNTTNAVGLSTFLASDVPLQEVVLQTAIPGLYFLPSGPSPADSAGLLNSQRMADLIGDVKSRFDLILIDSPPILGVSDASVLAHEADGTIIVLQHRKLPRQMLARVKQAVETVGGNVIGAVLNNVDARSDSNYHYYTSYYSYYSPTTTADPNLKSKGRKRKSTAPAPEVAAAPAPTPKSTHSVMNAITHPETSTLTPRPTKPVKAPVNSDLF